MSTISCYKKSLAHLLYRRHLKPALFFVSNHHPAVAGQLKSVVFIQSRTCFLPPSVDKPHEKRYNINSELMTNREICR